MNDSVWAIKITIYWKGLLEPTVLNFNYPVEWGFSATDPLDNKYMNFQVDGVWNYLDLTDARHVLVETIDI
jgi:hypothetical protein